MEGIESRLNKISNDLSGSLRIGWQRENSPLENDRTEITNSSSSSLRSRQPLIFVTLPEIHPDVFYRTDFRYGPRYWMKLVYGCEKKAGGRKRFKRVGRIRDLQVNRTILSIWWDVESVLLTHRLRIRISLVFYKLNPGNDSGGGDDYFDMIFGDGDIL